MYVFLLPLMIFGRVENRWSNWWFVQENDALEECLRIKIPVSASCLCFCSVTGLNNTNLLIMWVQLSACRLNNSAFSVGESTCNRGNLSIMYCRVLPDGNKNLTAPEERLTCFTPYSFTLNSFKVVKIICLTVSYILYISQTGSFMFTLNQRFPLNK